MPNVEVLVFADGLYHEDKIEAVNSLCKLYHLELAAKLGELPLKSLHPEVLSFAFYAVIKVIVEICSLRPGGGERSSVVLSDRGCRDKIQYPLSGAGYLASVVADSSKLQSA